jgi:hypothetical protein
MKVTYVTDAIDRYANEIPDPCEEWRFSDEFFEERLRIRDTQGSFYWIALL